MINLPEDDNLGRPLPEPDRLTVEDQYTMSAITGLLAGPLCLGLMSAEPQGSALVRQAKIIGRLAMEGRSQ